MPPVPPVNSQPLTIIQWNVRGVFPRMQDLNHLIQVHNPMVLVLSETFRNNRPFSIKGYTSFHNDKGLSTLVKNYIPARIVPHSPFNKECLVVEVVLNSVPYSIISVYDNNATCSVPLLKTLLDSFSGRRYLLGDFNAHSSLWGSPDTTPHANALADCFIDADLCLLNDGSPTYFSPATLGPSHLDLSLCDPTSISSTTWRSLPYGSSDHNPLLIVDDSTKPRWESSHLFWKLKNPNWKFFTNILSKFSVPPSVSGADIDLHVAQFTEFVCSAARQAIGLGNHKVNTSPNPTWWDRDCRLAVCNRKRARQKHRRSGLRADYLEFRRLCAVCTRTIKIARRKNWQSYVSRLTPSSSITSVWKRSKHSTMIYNPSYPPIKKPDGSFATSDADRAAALLAPFGLDPAPDDPTFILDNMFPYSFIPDPSGYDSAFTMSDLLTAIGTLTDSAMGPDLVHNLFLKNLPKNILEYLLNIFNSCWSTGVIPSSWKQSFLIPIIKPLKDPSLASSYRPIALNCCPLKLFEKLVSSRLVHFLETNSILPNYQFAFRKGLGCEDALQSLIGDITIASSSSQYTVCAFLDVKGAYDHTKHSAVKAALRSCKAPHNIYRFVSAYLQNRQYCLTIGTSSVTIDLKQGIPQGGVISCHLFSLVMSKVPCPPLPIATPGLYADDYKVHSSHKSLPQAVSNLNLALSVTYSNSLKWGVNFDPFKSAAMIFKSNRSTPPAPPPVHINGTPISYVSSHKFLGLIIDTRLNWKAHVTHVRTKCLRRLDLIRSVAHKSWGSQPSSLITLYVTLVRSVITYGLSVYGFCAASVFHTLNLIQNHALRVILSLPKGSPVDATEILCNLPPLSAIRDNLAVKFTAKKISQQLLSPSDLKSLNSKKSWPLRPPPVLTAYNAADFRPSPRILHILETKDRSDVIPPWIPPRPFNFNIDWLDGRKSEGNPSILKEAFYSALLSTNSPIHLYSDASYDPDTKANGIGIYCSTTDLSHSAKLPLGTTICTLEIAAISKAVKWALHNNFNNFVIISDCLSALTAIKNFNFTYKEISYLYSIPAAIIISFVWVPSHIGILGNEKADLIAKAALLDDNLPPRGRIPTKDALTIFSGRQNHLWKVAWNCSRNARFLHAIFPKPSVAPALFLNDKALATSIFRLLLDRANLPSWRHRVHSSKSPFCGNCRCLGDASHLLLDCRCFSVERAALRSSLQLLNVPFTLRNIFGGGPYKPPIQILILTALRTFLSNSVGLDTLLLNVF